MNGLNKVGLVSVIIYSDGSSLTEAKPNKVTAFGLVVANFLKNCGTKWHKSSLPPMLKCVRGSEQHSKMSCDTKERFSSLGLKRNNLTLQDEEEGGLYSRIETLVGLYNLTMRGLN